MKLMFFIFSILLFTFVSSCSSDEGVFLKGNECYAECEYWQVCDYEDNICVLNEEGFCNFNNDCESGYLCDEYLHICLEKLDCFDCKEWETCDDRGVCILKEERCYLSYNCDESNNEFCNLDTHKCEDLDDICDLDCMSWEECIINDDNEKACIIRPSLQWLKLDIFGLKGYSLFSPFDFGIYAYNSKENTLINYYTKDQDVSKIGKLDLNTKIQAEKSLVLLNNQTINGFCDNRVKSCQLVSFNKMKNKFMILSLDSSSLLYIDDRNVTEKVSINNEFPLDIYKPKAYFNNNGDTLFLYDNKYDYSMKAHLYSFSDSDLKWKLISNMLPNIEANCLVSDNMNLYSFGGKLNSEPTSNNELKVLKINYKQEDLEYDYLTAPEILKERLNPSCAYDEKRNLIFVYGGSKLVDEKDELNNIYYNDLWSFNPLSGEWKLILKNIETGSYLPLDEDGNRIYDADIDKPNFGKNQGKMIYDKIRDRLIIIGEIPYEKGVQVYTIKL